MVQRAFTITPLLCLLFFPLPNNTNTQPNTPPSKQQAVGRALDISSCLSARLVCLSWCEGVSASITCMCLTPGVISSLGPAAVARALERLAQVESVDIAIGPLRQQLPTTTDWVALLNEMLQGGGGPPGAGAGMGAGAGAGQQQQGAAGGANANASTSAAGAELAVSQVRPYGVQDMLALLRVLAQHRPGKKLPTLYVYNESLSSRDRPGLLDMRGKWRPAYVEVG